MSATSLRPPPSVRTGPARLIPRPSSHRDLPDRLDCLTSLRFFAAFAVFTHHFTGIGNHSGYGTAPLLFPYSLIGGHGVTFFFVLSGFLLAWGHRPGQHTGAFYWRRVTRIWPATLAAAPLAVYAFHVVPHKDIDGPSLLASLFLVQSWFPGVTPNLPGNGPTWTLGAELFFYALFPLVIRWARRTRTGVLLVVCGLGLVAMFATSVCANTLLDGPTSSWVQRHPVFFFPQFVLGLTMALALRRGWRVPVRPVVPLALLALVTYGYYQAKAACAPQAGAYLDAGIRPVLAVLAVLIVVAFAQREAAGHAGVLQSPVMVKLGMWSYSFYLVHHAVFRLCIERWGRAGDHNGVIIDLLGVAVLSLALSWAVFRYVEDPAARWLNRRMPQRWRKAKV
ncbi:acyltransferase [Streptomyces sp. NBC_00237]|uniref:acyltransferase family protein n=1 Tax=Streptomyces sp. NBC_00237 TaxID=2975687 RepID=UPI002254E5EA|nr:acyltransferase [Streptomyces sp. NBC_00237]MCX5200935.1 acyltransferase [Streptomyces sp. NBC_00237]